MLFQPPHVARNGHIWLLTSFILWSYPITGLDRAREFQEAEAPRFQDSRHLKVVRLSALRTGRSATKRIMSMKNSNDTIGNRTRDLPPCNAVPQPTAPPRDLFYNLKYNTFFVIELHDAVILNMYFIKI